MIARTGTNNFEETVRLSQVAQAAGVNTLRMVVPYDMRPSPEGLFRNRLIHRMGQDLLVYSRIERLCFPVLAIGRAGYASVTGNVVPDQVTRLCEPAAADRGSINDLRRATFWVHIHPGHGLRRPRGWNTSSRGS